MIYKGRVLNDGKIIDKEFKVYIPQIAANLEENTTILNVSLKNERIISKALVDAQIYTRSYVIAKNITDYPTSMKGVNVFTMERADGVTTVETTNTGEASNASADWSAADVYTPVPMSCLYNGAPHVNHIHRILNGLKFYAMTLTNMNNIDIKIGDECLVYMNGNEAYIIQFIGVQPQSTDDYDYVKK